MWGVVLFKGTTTWAAKANTKVPARPPVCKSLTKSHFPHHHPHSPPAVKGTKEKFIIFRLKELTRVDSASARPKVL